MPIDRIIRFILGNLQRLVLVSESYELFELFDLKFIELRFLLELIG